MPAKPLIANRGEIAIRILRAAAELGTRTVAVYSQDGAESLHRRLADESHALPKAGAIAYQDIDAILWAARDAGCSAILPGYGFLNENAEFAHHYAEANLTFVGPRPELLALFGNKAEARALAERLGVPILSGASVSTSPIRGRRFLRRPAGHRRHAHQGRRWRRTRHARGATPRGTGGRLCTLPIRGTGGVRPATCTSSNSCHAAIHRYPERLCARLRAGDSGRYVRLRRSHAQRTL